MNFFYKLVTTVVLLLALPMAGLCAGMEQAVEQFSRSSALRGAEYGVCVIDLTSGQTVAGINEDHCIIPASVMKIVSTATALKSLSPEYTFSTTVAYDGHIDADGVLHGNMIVYGGLDPTLSSQYFPDQEPFIDRCIAELHHSNITAIEGDIIIDESLAPDPAVPKEWMDGDVAQYYGAGAHALNYQDNQFSLVVDLSGNKAVVIDTVPHQDNLKIVNNVRIGGKAYTPGIFRHKNSNTLYMSGNVRRQSTPVEIWTTMPMPSEALRYDMKDAIECEGIAVKRCKIARNVANEQALFVYRSPALADICKSLLARSDNMYAESVFRAIATTNYMAATRERAVTCTTDLLNSWGIDTKGQTLYDGSGLSRANHITPHFLANVLALMAYDLQSGGIFPYLLPVCGKEGTVKHVLDDTPLCGNITLKSGSMTGIKCYAGYYPASSPQYAVVVMVNRFRCGGATLQKAIETLLQGLFL